MRIRSLDLARGFTVLFVAPIHAVLLFSRPEVYNTWFGDCLRFIAEGPGGQLFMLLMGTSFVLSNHTDLYSVLKKVVQLLVAGYALNFLKFVLPAMLNILPAGVYPALGIHRDVNGILQMFLTGDILQFAALALLVIYAISKLPCYPMWAIITATVICFMTPMLYDSHSANAVTNYLLELLSGQAPHVFFPVLPWIVYPLAGLVIGYAIKQQKTSIFRYSLMTGLILLLISSSNWLPYTHKFNVSFYRTYPPGTLYHLGIVLIWLYIMHWVSKINPHRFLLKPFTFSSRHITLIYFVQWALICWSLPFIGFRVLGNTASIGIAVLFGVLSIMVSAVLLLIA